MISPTSSMGQLCRLIIGLACLPVLAQIQNLPAGWSLMGNDSGAAVNVPAVFGNVNTPSPISASVTTVWSWDNAQGKWNFHAPSMTADGLASYAAGKGYSVLTSLSQSDGYWVNAKSAFALSLAASTSTSTSTSTQLNVGWNLVGVEAAFNAQSYFGNADKPTSISGSVLTVWSWDSSNGRWNFYAPSMTAQQLADYALAKGYGVLGSIAKGQGLWVNAKSGFMYAPVPSIFSEAKGTVEFKFYKDGSVSVPVSFIYAKDIDGDGIDEIFFVAFETQPNTPATYSNTSVHILGWQGGVFKEITSKWLPGSSNEVEGVGDLCFGDFNGDGRIDVFLSAYSDMEYPVHPYALMNQGDYFEKVQFPVQTWMHAVTCADINKDGFDDVLVAGYSNFPQYLGSAIGLVAYQGMVGSSGVAAGDFLGDGTVQAVFVDTGSTPNLDTKLFSLRIGQILKIVQFTPIATLPGPRLDLIFTDPEDPASSHDIRARAVDFNNDGKLDVVVFSNRARHQETYTNASEIQFLQNKGGGKFEDVTDSIRSGYDVGGMAGYFPEFRDFNGDGLVDLFVSIPTFGTGDSYSGYRYRHSTLLLQHPDGTFVDTSKSDLNALMDEGDGGSQGVFAKGPGGVFYLVREFRWRFNGLTRVSIYQLKPPK